MITGLSTKIWDRKGRRNRTKIRTRDRIRTRRRITINKLQLELEPEPEPGLGLDQDQSVSGKLLINVLCCGRGYSSCRLVPIPNTSCLLPSVLTVS